MRAVRVLLIIPAYNEEENLPKVVERVTAFAKTCRDYELDYIIINDGSTDRTGSLCRENGYRAIHLIQNLGIGGAVQTGYLFAKMEDYDIAVQYDGDGQHDIQCLDELLRPVLEDRCDVAIGSRFLEGTSGFRSTAMRRLGIRFLSGIIKLCAGCSLTDPTSGFRAVNRKAAALLSEDYPVDYPEPESAVALLKAGFRIREVQVNMFEREGGVSSISPWKSVYYMFKVSLAILCTGFRRKRRN